VREFVVMEPTNWIRIHLAGSPTHDFTTQTFVQVVDVDRRYSHVAGTCLGWPRVSCH